MGEDEWSQREPGSVAGSVVPPPVGPDEPAPLQSSLPRRKPKASGHQRAADADRLITSVRRVSGSPGPELSVAGSLRPAPAEAGPPQARPTQAQPTEVQPTQAQPTPPDSGPGQRGLRLAEQPAPASSQRPDNVRYLFRQNALAAEPAQTEPAQTETRPGAEDRTAEDRTAKDRAARLTSAGNAGAPAADEQVKRQATVTRPGSHRRGGAARAGSKLRSRITLVVAVLVVASTAVGTAFALVKNGPSANSAGTRHLPGGGRTGPNGLRGLSSAAIVRAQAARWVAREISKSAIVACDAVMCTELFNQGIVASNLLVLAPSAPSPLGADVVIASPALRSQFGKRLAREYAPTVIASFGTGKTRVDVRVIASDGAAAYEQALTRDLVARQRYGGVLLRNGRISVSASARPDLIAGLVDPRLLMMLPVLASQHPIKVLGFYDRAPRSAQGVPLSGTELAGYDAAAGLPAGSYLRWLLVFLRGQRAPLLPTSVTTARVDGREIVRVQFSRPSPIGLLNGQ